MKETPADSALPAKASNRWTIQVDAGPYARRHLPVSLLLPPAIAELAEGKLPWLDRAGRQRTIPCQLQETEEGTRLWWVISEMEPHEKDQYVLTFDRRERNSPIRWKSEKIAHGSRLFEEELRLLDVVIPKNRVPQVHLVGPAGPLVKIRPHAWGGESPSAGIKRAMASPPHVDKGPIFYSTAIAHDVRGPSDLLFVRETFHLQTYLSHKGTRVIDLSFGWHAVACGLWLRAVNPKKGVFQPGARLEWESPPTESCSGQGRISPAEWNGQPSEWVEIQQGFVRAAIIARTSPTEISPTWRAVDQQTIEIDPMPPTLAPTDLRLAVGEKMELHLRLWLMPAVGRSAGDIAGMASPPAIEFMGPAALVPSDSAVT